MIFNSTYWKILKNRGFNLSIPRLLNYFFFLVFKPISQNLSLFRTFYSPVSVSLWITTRCNKSCDFCPYILDLNKNSEVEDINFIQFQPLLNRWPISKSMHIKLYGGEPFLNNDLFPMVSLAKKRGMVVSVITNGLFLKKRSEQLKKNLPDVLTISYYHEDHEIIKEQLNYLPNGCVKQMNFILSKENLAYLKDVTKLALEFNFDILSIDPLSTADRSHKGVVWNDDKDFFEMKEVVQSLTKDSNLFVKYPKTEKNPAKLKCQFLWDSIYIIGNKKWAPCCEWGLNDYMNFDVKNLWNSDWYRRQRKALFTKKIENKYCKGCIYNHDDSMNI